MKLRLKKGKAIKDKFVLIIGDEGAIFCYFDNGILANKLYVDSPTSSDVKLIDKLLETYPKAPVYMLVDVIEQNYSQQVLPPVSALGIRQQVQRRIKRDFQPNDFTNVFFINRSKEGRKDWNFLFISLANSDPFAKWLEIILNHNNPFKGVYLLPMESTKLVEDINKSILESSKEEWELLILHNKTGGFRIVAFKSGKLIFTRLAQNLIGDNIPDIIVGNLEQEISNTVEYLRRMAFKAEAESKITIIAGTEVLQKIDIKNLKFGAVHLFTPYEIAQKLNLAQSVTDKDKFADILMATHFATNKKHVLKVNSPYTKKLEALYTLIRASYLIFGVLLLLFMGLTVGEVLDISDEKKEMASVKDNLNQLNTKLSKQQDQYNKLPKSIGKLLDIMTISNMFPEDKHSAIRIINKITPQFDQDHMVDDIEMKVDRVEKSKKVVSNFQMDISMKFIIDASAMDDLSAKSADFKKTITKVLPEPKYKVVYSTEPKVEQSQFEKVTGTENSIHKDAISIPAKITITGEL